MNHLQDNRARDEDFEVFIRLENLNAAAVGGEIDRFDDSGVPFFRFDEAAQERFYAWRTR